MKHKVERKIKELEEKERLEQELMRFVMGWGLFVSINQYWP